MIDPRMDSGTNSTQIGMNFDPVMSGDMACGLMILALTLITICFFCTFYRIAADDPTLIQVSEIQINRQKIKAPPNTPNNSQDV